MRDGMTPTDTASLDVLLAHIDKVRDEAIAEIEAGCRAECEQLQAQAGARAAEQLLEAKNTERRRARLRIRAARAAARGRLRQRHQAERARFLASQWPPLLAALDSRWQSADSRRGWIRMALHEASEHLMLQRWKIEHGPVVASAEIDQQLAPLRQRHPGLEICFAPVESLGPGLRICSGAAVLDATLDGLLARRARIEGLLLHVLSQRLNEGTS